MTLFLSGLCDNLYAQIQEPELQEIEAPTTPLDEGLHHGIGFNTVLNNFGFGVGVEYKRVLAPRMEGTVTLQWTGLRDVSEQTFTDYIFGQQTIPNKYQRAFAFPLTFGIRQRIFANQVSDQYRFFISAALGPVVAFTYPYFDDRNGNGYQEQFQQYFEEPFDVFTGLKDGDFKLGLTGEIKFSVDIGQNFARLTSVQFGYAFHYFKQGLQIMQPNQPIPVQIGSANQFPYRLEPEGCEVPGGECQIALRSFFSPQKYFGTPQISLIFGRMW